MEARRYSRPIAQVVSSRLANRASSGPEAKGKAYPTNPGWVPFRDQERDSPETDNYTTWR